MPVPTPEAAGHLFGPFYAAHGQGKPSRRSSARDCWRKSRRDMWNGLSRERGTLGDARRRMVGNGGETARGIRLNPEQDVSGDRSWELFDSDRLCLYLLWGRLYLWRVEVYPEDGERKDPLNFLHEFTSLLLGTWREKKMRITADIRDEVKALWERNKRGSHGEDTAVKRMFCWPGHAAVARLSELD